MADLHLNYFSASDIGRIRAVNEDFVAIDERYGIAILADGMGGHNAGEVASEMAVQSILSRLIQYLSINKAVAHKKNLSKSIEGYFKEANRIIFDAATLDSSKYGMGTTLVAAVLKDDEITIAHVGDSRAYILRDSNFVQLTRDHSLLQDKISKGLLVEGKIENFKYKNIITRAVGVAEDVVPEIIRKKIAVGDCFLICSDGLTDMLTDLEIGAVLKSEGAVKEKGQLLIAMANQAGGRDNISVILLNIELI
jgi:serine/threonine protein phosphatase PrpC